MDTLDSRVHRPRGIRALVRRAGAVVHGEPVYCLSCGRPDGYVPVELPPGVFYLCGECEARYGVPDALRRRDDLEQLRST